MMRLISLNGNWQNTNRHDIHRISTWRIAFLNINDINTNIIEINGLNTVGIDGCD